MNKSVGYVRNSDQEVRLSPTASALLVVVLGITSGCMSDVPDEQTTASKDSSYGRVSVGLRIDNGENAGYEFNRLVIGEINESYEPVIVNLENIDSEDSRVFIQTTLPCVDCTYVCVLQGLRLATNTEVEFESNPIQISAGAAGPQLHPIFDIPAPVDGAIVWIDPDIRFSPGVAIRTILPLTVKAGGLVRVELRVVPPEDGSDFSLDFEVRLGEGTASASDIAEPGFYEFSVNAEARPGRVPLEIAVASNGNHKATLVEHIRVLESSCGDENPSCDESTPYCVNGNCVECRDLADCREGGRTNCVDGRCEGCVDDAECGDEAPFCNSNLCVNCIGDEHCGIDMPACLDGHCVECRSSEDCDPRSTTPICAADGSCVGCANRDDCSEVTGGFVCDLSGPDNGTCECGTRRAPCPVALPYCVEDESACVACMVDAHCGPGEVCRNDVCEESVDPGCDAQTASVLALMCPELSADNNTLVVRLASGADQIAFGNLTIRIEGGPEGTRFVGSQPMEALESTGIDRGSNHYFDNIDGEGQLRIFMEPEDLVLPAAIDLGPWIEISLACDDGFTPGQRLILAVDGWLTATNWTEQHVETVEVLEVAQ